MTEASSRPTNPKQITPKEFRTKRGLGGILKSAAVMVVPKRDQTDKNGGSDKRSDCAKIVDPLADAEADDIKDGEEREQD